jgi:hypothetical protein
LRIGLSVVAIILALIGAVAPLSPALIERWFSTGLFPHLQRIVTPVSNAIPFALFDLLCVGAAAILIAAVIRAARDIRRSRRFFPLMKIVGQLIVAAAVVYLWFLLFWGLNYRRVAMVDRLNVDEGPPASEAVVQLGLDAAAQLNALHAGAHRIGWPDQPADDQSLALGFVDVQRALSDAAPATPGRLKRSLFGPYFRWASVDGMINPFALEVLANPDLLPFERPFIAAHEWAHLAGFADESEASFVGWLACLRAGVPARYSAWLLMYWQVNGEVNQPERERLAAALGPGPRQDLEAIVARLRRGEWPWLRNAGWRVYDSYLKANRVEEGIRSYGAVVTLILRAKYDDEGIPLRRTASPGDRPPGS